MSRKGSSTKVLQKALWAALGGLFAFGAPAWSAPTADLTILVGIQDTFPPAPVADLAALATITPGQVLLTWTAPREDAPFPGSLAVSGYVVKYATFSVDSLLGDTTAWWALATSTSLPLTPSAPGTGETVVLDLDQGTRYWFAVRGIDDVGLTSPIDVNSATPGLQANALTRDSRRPGPVGGLVVTRTGPDYTLDWPPTTLNSDGSPATDIAGYRVYRSTGLYDFGASSTSAAFFVGVSSSGFVFTPDPVNDVFYLVVAVDTGGNESPVGPSNYLHVTPSAILGQTGKASDGSYGRAYVPEGLMPELRIPGQDLLLTVDLNTDPAMNPDPARRLGTYTVGLEDPGGTAAPADFAFSRAAMRVVLAYEPPGPAVVNPDGVGVLWWNGSAWIKLGRSEVDPILKTVSFETALPGIYQIRNFQVATNLSLDKASVFPRVFSPNGDGVNDVVYFVLDNPRMSAVDGVVLDMSGADIGTLRKAGAGAPSGDTYMWDGRDNAGNIAPAGVYIYQIRGEGQTFSGTVVLAQ